MDHYEGEQHINVGTGVDLSIRDLAETVRDVVHPERELEFDTSKPDGAPRKLLDVSRHQRARLEGDDRAARGHRVDLRLVLGALPGLRVDTLTCVDEDAGHSCRAIGVGRGAVPGG